MNDMPDINIEQFSGAALRARNIPPRPRRGDAPICYDPTPVHCRGEPLDEVWWSGRQWAVTSHGIERRNGCYTIASERLGEGADTQYGWPAHMSGKSWIDIDDFMTAWLIALTLHGVALPGAEIRSALARAQPSRLDDK
jgi:hypothetical protein